MDVSYGYSNARIRAMKSYLLDRVFYERLIGMKEVDEITAALEATPYRQDISEATLRKPGVVGVEEGLRKNTVKCFQKILKMVDGETEKLVKIILGRWDVHNIKTVIRGKHIGAPIEEVLESLVPAGELSEAFLNEFAREDGVKKCIDLLATWRIDYAKPLTAGFPVYAKTKNIADLELSLDRFYFESSFGKLTKKDLNTFLLREIVQREIDSINIMTIIRLTREKVEKEEIKKFYINGGKIINIEKFEELCALKAPEDIVNQLRETPYHDALNKGLDQYFKTGFVSPIQRNMEEMIIRKSIALFRADPLSIGLIIAYIGAKINEVVNLRIIIRGKYVKLPEKKIREAVVIV